ncbi:MAG: hypothetical protein HZB29_01455 [Nitrospinae bacterium]|nr:hypothetical protein [Nitrospinota bacterium]
MKASAHIKLEMRNPRYPDRELREHLSELIHYSRYAGIDLGNFNQIISRAVLVDGEEGPDLRYGGKLVLETTQKTVNLVNRLVQMYPVFSTWEIKVSQPKKSSARSKTINMKEKRGMATKKKAAKKATAKKPAKKAAKKKAAKKK